MADEKAPEVPMAGGAVTSSKIPRLDYIPTEASVRLAERFEKGVERKGIDKAWNALSKDQQVLTDIPFILERIGHVKYHADKLRDKILAGTPLSGDDDAGAIAWGGAFLCCATKALADQKGCSACGGEGAIKGASACPACKGSGKQRS